MGEKQRVSKYRFNSTLPQCHAKAKSQEMHLHFMWVQDAQPITLSFTAFLDILAEI